MVLFHRCGDVFKHCDIILLWEDSLQFLARESGGRYLQGSNERIRTEIENLYRAYYEIAFPDLPGAGGTARRITLTSKRPEISIHTLRSLE